MNMHPALLPRGPMAGQLCQLVADFNGKVPNGGCILEPKLDGIRALWIDGQFVTREGSPIEGAGHIAHALRWLDHDGAVPLFVDGEYVVGEGFKDTLQHFQSRGRRGDAGTFHIFDVMPMRVWRGQDVSPALHARRRKVDDLFEPLVKAGVAPMPWSWINDADDARRAAEAIWAAGGEGVVLKHANSTYRLGKSSNWQRIKKVLTYDVRITDTVAQADHGDRLGALIGELDGVRVRIAHGFTDRERFNLWQRRDSLPGVLAEVEAMDRTETGKLRHGRFVRLREDRL